MNSAAIIPVRPMTVEAYAPYGVLFEKPGRPSDIETRAVGPFCFDPGPEKHP
jgi:hypothetical protein